MYTADNIQVQTFTEKSYLVQKKKQFWKKTFWTSRVFTCYVSKSVLIVLLWEFSTGLLFNLFLRPTRYIQIAYIHDALVLSILSSIVFPSLTASWLHSRCEDYTYQGTTLWYNYNDSFGSKFSSFRNLYATP